MKGLTSPKAAMEPHDQQSSRRRHKTGVSVPRGERLRGEYGLSTDERASYSNRVDALDGRRLPNNMTSSAKKISPSSSVREQQPGTSSKALISKLKLSETAGIGNVANDKPDPVQETSAEESSTWGSNKCEPEESHTWDNNQSEIETEIPEHECERCSECATCWLCDDYEHRDLCDLCIWHETIVDNPVPAQGPSADSPSTWDSSNDVAETEYPEHDCKRCSKCDTCRRCDDYNDHELCGQCTWQDTRLNLIAVSMQYSLYERPDKSTLVVSLLRMKFPTPKSGASAEGLRKSIEDTYWYLEQSQRRFAFWENAGLEARDSFEKQEGLDAFLSLLEYIGDRTEHIDDGTQQRVTF